MNGSAHSKIGALSCAIVSTVPAIYTLPIFNNSLIHMPQGISLSGVGLAFVAALATDADSQHSKMNRMNPVTGIVNEGIEVVERVIKIILKLFLTMGLAIFLLINSQEVIQQISGIYQIRQYAKEITYGTIAILFAIGLANDYTLKKIPLLGDLYEGITNAVDNVSSLLKRAWMFSAYIGAGICVIIYNYTHEQEFPLFCIGLLFIAIAIFPHRSFLHSLEGLLAFTAAVSYLLNRVGYGNLTGAFFVGYASHIYLADIFTKEGVPLFSAPRFLAQLLNKMGIKRGIQDILEKIGQIKLRLPPQISTGSKSGNMFEMGYVLVLLITAVACYIVYGGGIRLI